MFAAPRAAQLSARATCSAIECGLGVTVVPAAAATTRPAVRFRTLGHGAAPVELTAMTRTDPDPLVGRLTELTRHLSARQALA